MREGGGSDIKSLVLGIPVKTLHIINAPNVKAKL